MAAYCKGMCFQTLPDSIFFSIFFHFFFIFFNFFFNFFSIFFIFVNFCQFFSVLSFFQSFFYFWLSIAIVDDDVSEPVAGFVPDFEQTEWTADGTRGREVFEGVESLDISKRIYIDISLLHFDHSCVQRVRTRLAESSFQKFSRTC